jgi:beta-galactosidase
MINDLELKNYPFGGDYSPEQWPEELQEEDIRLMRVLGVNTVTINVHSWIFDEPKEGAYDFSWLDRVMSRLKQAGISVIMATGTTATPAWLYQKDHGILKTDIKGRALKHGVRERFCPTSPTYIAAIGKLVRELARHFKDEKNILLWHLNNELSGFCYCEHCEQEFRKWLERKYGTIKVLNDAWCAAMWGRYYTSFDDIMAPTELNELYVNVNRDGFDLDSLPTEAIEYARFMSEQHAKLFELESECIKEYIPEAVCTNNFQFRDRFNYHRIAQALDVIALDIYPNRGEPSYEAAFNLDVARNFIAEDKPFLIMEMSPNHASWAKCCSAKRPGEIGKIAMDNIAHGANSALYFQIRRTPAGFEKFHGAMISHAGHLDTRIARELKSLGEDLAKLPLDLQKEGLCAQAAVIHDWDEKLGVEIPCTVQKMIDYSAEVKHYYRYFHDRNINVDVISLDQDFSRYRLIVAPMVCMVREEHAQRLGKFVEDGGVLVLTYYSGYTNECDYMYLGGQPGPFREIAGLWGEEIDGARPEDANSMVFSDGSTCGAGWMCDVIRTEGADVIARYGAGYYKDTPCLTENKFGKGTCIYIGAKPDKKGVDRILDMAVGEAGVNPVLSTPGLVRATQRGPYLFLINHGETEEAVELLREMTNVLTGEKERRCVLLAANAYAVYRE